MGYFNNNVLFDSNTQSWKCLLCIYTIDKHQWYQVFGHAAAMHGYTSRTPNERRGIRIQDKYSNGNEINLPQELRPYMTDEIDNRRILILVNENNEIRRQCGYFGEIYVKGKGITTHIGKCTMKPKQENLPPLLHRLLLQPSQPQTTHDE